MKTFNDAAGRTWTVSINIGTVMRVKDELDLDLLQPESGETPVLTRLGTDEILLARTIATILEKQFETHEVDEGDIYTAFDGETLLAAQTAFYEELIVFFQKSGRTERATAVRKQQALIAAGVRVAEEEINALDVEETIRGAFSGELPVPSASTLEN